MNICDDNRFEIIEKAKEALLDSTNIEQSSDEMKVLDNFLFRCWQMGWLDKYESKKNDSWIPCSERLPEELVPVNITWTNREPSFYYRDIKDKPFTATAVYCNEKWFWWSSICEDVLAEYGRNDAEIVADIVAEVDEDVEILAWMPLPTAFEGGE